MERFFKYRIIKLTVFIDALLTILPYYCQVMILHNQSNRVGIYLYLFHDGAEESWDLYKHSNYIQIVQHMSRIGRDQ